jgi:hypothetical protein
VPEGTAEFREETSKKQTARLASRIAAPQTLGGSGSPGKHYVAVQHRMGVDTRWYHGYVCTTAEFRETPSAPLSKGGAFVLANCQVTDRTFLTRTDLVRSEMHRAVLPADRFPSPAPHGQAYCSHSAIRQRSAV